MVVVVNWERIDWQWEDNGDGFELVRCEPRYEYHATTLDQNGRYTVSGLFPDYRFKGDCASW